MPAYRTGFALPLDELRDEIDRLWTTLVTAPPLHGWGPRSEESVFSVSGDSLVLKGARRAVEMGADCVAASEADRPVEAPAGEKVVWLLRERGSGAFERRLKLPVAVDSLRVEARLVDGVLTVVCPKLAACQPRKVEVRGG